MSYRDVRVFALLLFASPAFAGTLGQLDPGNLFMGLLVVLMALAVVGVVFLVLREFMCWYWKMNRVVVLLERISEKLGVQNQDSRTGK